MPNIPKDDTPQRRRKITSNMVLAELKDLKIGTVYYWVCNAAKGYAVPNIVRPRIKAVNKYGKDETIEEYEEYKDFLRTIVRRGECLVIKK